MTKYENGVGFAKYISSPDDNGVYTLTNVARGAILEFSSVGFITQEVQYEGTPAVNVILAPDREALEEAMVVAYGTVKKGS